MAFEDTLGNPDPQELVNDLYSQQADGSQNVDPQAILNRLGRKLQTTAPRAPAAPEAPAPQHPRGAPNNTLPPLAPLETAPAPKPEAPKPTTPPKDDFSEYSEPVTPDTPSPAKGEGAADIESQSEPVQPQQPGQAPTVGGFPAVQPLDEQPFRTGGAALNKILGTTTGMKTGDEAYDAQQQRIKEAEESVAAATVEKRDFKLGAYTKARAAQLGITDPDQVEALRKKIQEGMKVEEKAADALAKAKTTPETQARWRDVMERIPPAAVDQMIDTVAGAARLAMAVPTGADTTGAQEKISELKAAIEAKVSHDWFNSDPAKDEDFGSKIVQGLVSTATFAAMGAAGKAAGLGATATTAIAGALPQAEQQYTQAEAASPGYIREFLKQQYGVKVSEATAGEIAKWGMFATGALGGSTEAIPIGHLFERLEHISGGGLTRLVGVAAASAGEEGVQEALQQVIQNLSTKGLLDPNQDISEGVAENALIGAISGAAVAGALGGAKMGLDRLPSTAVPPPPAAAPPPPGGAPSTGAPPAAPVSPGTAAPPPGGAPAPPSPQGGAGVAQGGAAPVAASEGTTAAQAPAPGQPPSQEDQDVATLRRIGMPDDFIEKLSPEKRRAEVADAIKHGVAGAGPEIHPEDRKKLTALLDVVTDPKFDPKAPIKLDDKGFSQDEIARLESAGLAANGAMTYDQMQAWSQAIESGQRPGAQPAAPATPAPAEKPNETAAPAGAQQPAPPAPPATPAAAQHPRYQEALDLVRKDGKASTAHIQRKLGLKYNDAATVVGQLQANGVISPPSTTGKREVLPVPGAKAAPVQAESGADVTKAAEAIKPSTPAQGEAGNYQKAHIKARGLPPITLEVGPGGTRTGKTKEGKEWEQKFSHAYGYFPGIKGGDGQDLDVYLNHDNGVFDLSGGPVFVLDENDRKTGEFRQHKVFVGFKSDQDAEDAYLGSQGKTKKQIRGIVEMSREEFSVWKDGDLTKPVGEPARAETAEKTPAEAEKPTETAAGPRAAAEETPEAHAEHVAAIEDALRSPGVDVDPADVMPVDIQRAAELVADTEFAPDFTPEERALAAIVEGFREADMEAEHGPVESEAEKEHVPSGVADEQEDGSSGPGAPTEGEGAVGVGEGVPHTAEEAQDREPHRGGEGGAQTPRDEGAENGVVEASLREGDRGATTEHAEADTKPAESERASVPDGGASTATERPGGDQGERPDATAVSTAGGVEGRPADNAEAGEQPDLKEAPTVGQFVKFELPAKGKRAKKSLRGKITTILKNGKIEVRVAEGGYHEIDPKEVTEWGNKPSEWLKVGVNSEGSPVFEDQRGVRSFVRNGVRQTEPVLLSVSLQTGVQTELRTKRDAEYKTMEETGPTAKVPDVLYHGTPRPAFDKFDREGGSASKRLNTIDKVGVWFTDSEEDAKKFAGKAAPGHVVAAKVDIKKPLVVHGFEGLAAVGRKAGLVRKDVVNADNVMGYLPGNEFRKYLEANGYDGIHMVEGGAGDFKESKSDYWIALHPEQIEKIAAKPKETIVGAAITAKDGRVFASNTHTSALAFAGDAMKTDASDLLDKGLITDFDGFLTSTGRLVSREEATKVANAADQPKKEELDRELDAAQLTGMQGPAVHEARVAALKIANTKKEVTDEEIEANFQKGLEEIGAAEPAKKKEPPLVKKTDELGKTYFQREEPKAGPLQGAFGGLSYIKERAAYYEKLAKDTRQFQEIAFSNNIKLKDDLGPLLALERDLERDRKIAQENVGRNNGVDDKTKQDEGRPYSGVIDGAQSLLAGVINRLNSHPTSKAALKAARTAEEPAKVVAKRAVKSAISAGDDFLKGMTELFGGGKTIGEGLNFDKDTYEKAKPYFYSGAAHFKEFIADVGDLARRMVHYLKERGFSNQQISAVGPYVVQFVKDVKNGVIDLAKEIENRTKELSGEENVDTGTGGEGKGALEPVAAGEGGRTEEGGQTRGEPAGGGPVVPEANRPLDEGPGLPGARSGGGGAAAVHPPEAGGRGRTSALGKKGIGRKGKRITPESASGNVEPQAVPNVPASNFRITEEVGLGIGKEAEKFNDNLSAITVLKAIERENRRATPDEQRALARYVGWGGLSNAFPVQGQYRPEWKERGEALAKLLTPEEIRQASASTTDAHYTSKAVVDAMWNAVRRLGYKGGLAYELSMGTGNFLGLIPDDLAGATKFIGIEQDSLTSRIARTLYPQETVLHSGTQNVPIPDGEGILSIGNPPFGRKTNTRWQFKPEFDGLSIHNQFFLAGLDSLAPGGIQAMVVSRYLMDAQDQAARLKIAAKAEFLGAFRLAQDAFQENAGTQVVTDVVFLKRRSAADEADMEKAIEAYRRRPEKAKDAERERLELSRKVPDWVKTTAVSDPLGGEDMVVNAHYAGRDAIRSGRILGRMERSGTQYGKEGITVQPDKSIPIEQRLARAVAQLPENVMTAGHDAIEQSKIRHAAMSEALEVALSGDEIGDVKIKDGKLLQIYERETPTGGWETARRELTPESPWSRKLYQDDKGNYYTFVAKVDEKGKKIKIGRNNDYERKYFENNVLPARLRLGETKFNRLGKLAEIEDLWIRQVNLETNDAPSEEMEENRAKLAAAYKEYTERNGFLNEPANYDLLNDLPNGARVLSLEKDFRRAVSEGKAKRTGGEAKPATASPDAILSRRVQQHYEPATSAETPADALSIALSDTGKVDIGRIASLLGISEEEATKKLTEGESPLAYYDPDTMQHETRDDYLTGQVARKYQSALAAGLQKNAEDLAKVQPAPIGAENITIHPGATWVPTTDYEDFLKHLSGESDIEVQFAPSTAAFNVIMPHISDPGKFNKWSVVRGSGAVDATLGWLFGKILNTQSTRIMDEVTDEYGNEKKVLNEAQTALARLKAQEISNEFTGWILKDPQRRARLVAAYNEKFNTRVNRQHDGSHLVLPGKVPDAIVEMRRHQKNAIWRGVHERFVLYDHVVGSGKTYTAIARIMERRRMGLSKKPMVVVPNHLVQQWATSFYKLYPGAKILAASEKDLEAKSRRRFFARIGSGDYDAVIVPHSSFGFISLSKPTKQRFLEEQLRLAIQAVTEAEQAAAEDGEGGGRFKPFRVKEAERLRNKIEGMLDNLAKAKQDKIITFEQMGVDDITVDEAHEFKNLFYSTKMDSGVRGMGNKQGSGKALDLYSKIKYLQERGGDESDKNRGGSVAFLTGTPISNSAVEMYTMMRYLAPKDLSDLGLENFDAWRAQFVTASSRDEPTDSGSGVKEVTRLGREWSNMQALMELYYSFTDSVPQEDINRWYEEDNNGKKFPVPAVNGGGRKTVVVQPTKAQVGILSGIVYRFNHLKDIDNSPPDFARNKEMLQLMDLSRKVATDARLADPQSDSLEVGGKLDKIAENVAEIYKKWDADAGTQAIFLDRGVKSSKGDKKIIDRYDELIATQEKALAAGDDDKYREIADKLQEFDPNEIAELKRAARGGWNAYDELKRNLVARGIPADQIRFVQEANTPAEKQAIFDDVQDGKIRILIGSTPRMGAGTNIQERLVALHHGDVTWKPSDIEQREGRIIRQGNSLLTKYGDKFAVDIIAYVTERTIDAKMWDLNSSKLKMVNGIRQYNGAHSMEFDDSESVGMAETAALASGDPLFMERVRLASDITKLEMLERAHVRNQYGVEERIEAAERVIRDYPELIAKEKAKAAALMEGYKAAKADVDARRVVVQGKEYSNEFDAQTAAHNAIIDQRPADMPEGETKPYKYSVEVGGTKHSNKEGIAGAIHAALGSNMPPATIGGNKLIRRHEIVEAIIKATPVDGRDHVIGQMLGVDLVARAAPYVDHVRLELALRKGEVDLADDSSTGGKDGTKVSAQIANAALVGLEKKANQNAQSTGNWMQNKVDTAKATIPVLKEEVGAPFKQADELERKRERFVEVSNILRERKAEAEKSGNADAVPDIGEDDDLGAMPTKRASHEILTPRAMQAEPQIQERLKAIIRNLVGDAVEVQFVSDEKLADITKKSTSWGKFEGKVTGAYQPYRIGQKAYKGIVYLALGNQNDQDAMHEAYHVFEDLLANDNELAVLRRETERIRKYLVPLVRHSMTAKQVAALGDEEVRALGFEYWLNNREKGNVALGVRVFFNKIMEFARRVGNMLRGLGSDTTESIWRKVESGEAAEREMRETGGLFKGEALPTMREVGAAVKEFYTSKFQPELVSDRALQADPKAARYRSATAQEKDAIIKQAYEQWHYWNKLPYQRRVDFLHNMETRQPQANAEEDAMAADWRALLDNNWSDEQGWGSMASFVNDYVPHIWEKPESWRAFAESMTKQLGPTWFQKKRTLDLIQDGLNAGLKLKYTNPAEIMTHRLLSGADMRMRMELLYQYKSMGLAWEGAQGGAHLVKRGWLAINAPDRKQWVIAPDIKPIWKNAVEAHGMWRKDGLQGGIFRGWMQLKSVWVPLKLAVSAFHPLHVLHINQSDSIARGLQELFRGDPEGLRSILQGLTTFPWTIAQAVSWGNIQSPEYKEGRTARAAWEKRPADQNAQERAIVALMNDGGFAPKMSEQMRIKAEYHLAEAWQKLLRREDTAKSGLATLYHGLRRGMEKFQEPIFEKWIPALKTAAYLKAVASWARANPTLLGDDTQRQAAFRAIAKSVDNRFGEMFYGGLFWDRTLKDLSIASFLSLGWNLGFAREFGGAAIEAGITRPLSLVRDTTDTRKTISGATNKIGFVLTYVGTAMLINAAMSWGIGGDTPDPLSLDVIFPRIGGTNPDGSPRRITNMFYLREIPMLIKHIQDRGGNVFSGAIEMLWNKLMFQPFVEIYNNKDYWGYNIWDENAPIYKQVMQGLKHVLGEQTSPISLSGADRAAELSGKPLPTMRELAADPSRISEYATTKGVPLSIAGFGPAPAYVEKDAAQNRIGYLYGLRHSGAKTEAEGELSHAKYSARTAILVAKAGGDQAALSEAIKKGRAAGLSDRYMSEVGKVATDVYLFSQLPKADQEAVLRDYPDHRDRYLPKARKDVKVEFYRQPGGVNGSP